MDAVKERLRLQLAENVASLYRLEKWIQIHAGKYPIIYFTLFRLLHSRGDLSRVVTPETQLVIEGFPRSGNTFARRAFVMAQAPSSDKIRIAHHLHVPAQVVRAARLRIPTLVLIRRPRDAVQSFAIWNPISIDQALRYYVAFYETVEKYRDAYVLGLFEEVTGDFGKVIERMNDKFGTTFTPFRHDEENVSRLFADIETFNREKYGESLSERKVHRPSANKEIMKHEVQYDSESSRRKELIAEAEAVYDRLTDPLCKPSARNGL